MTPEIILSRTGIDVTTIQQGDEAWHRLRLGVITASESAQRHLQAKIR
ncbi:exonuclease [Enterobacter cancerogenus]|uniref:Exonuclease n=1 Tax=Enterobacter cancerogenus TaxID=69218 RepID=A0A484YCM0_9ENTR|nr:exonuclease [Enterobacter cancerogenus]